MKKKVLIVDDEVDIVKILTLRIEYAGYEVVVAYNGLEALDKLKTERVDLILLDLLMPVMDGYEFYSIIKKDEQLRTIPIVVITALPAVPEEKRKELDVQGFLIKPFEPKQLLDTIQKAIKKK